MLSADAPTPTEPAEPSPPAGPADDPLELLRHELKNPLTAVRGQAQLLRRRAARLDGVADGDRTWLLERSALIEAAVAVLVERVERIDREPREADGGAPGDP